MKQKDEKDLELSKMLKEGSYQETTNEWFTPRVLNKLPAKPENTAKHLGVFFYIAAALLCAGFWIWLFVNNDPTVITVRDIVYFGLAGLVTLILTFSPIVTIFRNE